MKKKLFVGIYVIVLLCCISVYSYIKIEINRLEKDLKDYLIREGHYNDLRGTLIRDTWIVYHS